VGKAFLPTAFIGKWWATKALPTLLFYFQPQGKALMNHIYHSIWNDALGAWIAVSEIASGQGKRSSNRRKNRMTASPLKDWQSSTRLLATGLLLCCSTSWALPTGDQLVAGQATVSNPAAHTLQINQASQQAIINWQGFSIAPNEAVNINQPNAQAALLNRVVGQDASQIQGQLHANGQVYLVNPNGVLFGKTAQVDVGGLIASTHNISNADFMTGHAHFTQDGATGSVDNQGSIKTSEGGVVAFIGETVSNSGSINTPKGTTVLAAGKTVDLDFQGNGLVEVKVSEAALAAQITNKGAIQADGGRVVLTAKAAGQLLDTVINQAGIIRAQGLVERNGEIILDGGDNGTVKVSGTLDVNGQQTGGKISVTGNEVQLNNGAIVTATGNIGGGVVVIGDKQNTRQTTIAQGATINVQTLDSGKAGTINVFANMTNGTVNLAGQLNASALNNGDGGVIDTSAAHVIVPNSAKISTHAVTGKTGTWIIDPADFTIAASGGDITGAALSASLASTGVTIFSTAGANGVNGDVNVNDVVRIY
jgi:filamentous hemagglutinin family protein